MLAKFEVFILNNLVKFFLNTSRLSWKKGFQLNSNKIFQFIYLKYNKVPITDKFNVLINCVFCFCLVFPKLVTQVDSR